MRIALLAVIFAACSVFGTQGGEGSSAVTIEAHVPPPQSEPGLGKELNPLVRQAIDNCKINKPDDAEKQLDEALAGFAKLRIDTTKEYLSFFNKAEYEAYLKESGKKAEQVVWMDLSYQQALHTKAYVTAGRKKYDEALKQLDEEVKAAPYSANAWSEKAYSYLALKKYEEALDAYKKASELASKIPTQRAFKVGALRGIGESNLLLNRLAEARQAYEDALKIEPNHRMSQEKLQYIQQRERDLKEREELEKANPAPGE